MDKLDGFQRILIWAILSLVTINFVFTKLPEYSNGTYRLTLITFPMAKLGADFTANYVAANSVRKGLNPYKNNSQYGTEFSDPYAKGEWSRYVYPMIGAYLFIPLSFFPVILAYKLWIIIFLILLLLSIVYLTKLFPSKLLVFTTLVNISFFSYPLLFALERGVSDVIILILLCIAFYYQIKRHNDWLSSLAIAVAILVKLYPGIFLLYFIIRKKWGLVRKILLFLLILIILTFNLEVYKSSITALKNFSTEPNIWIGNHSLISFLSLNRWAEIYSLPISFISILYMTGTTFYFIYQRSKEDSLFDFLEWGICFILMTIIPSISNDYNLILQIFTIASIFYYFTKIKKFSGKNLVFATLAILLSSFLFASTFIVFADPLLVNKFPILFCLWVLIMYVYLDKQAYEV